MPPEPDVEEENLDTDCSSFNHKQTSIAKWQEAGVRNIRLKWVWIGGSNGGLMRELYLPQMVFGIPTEYQNSDGTITHLSPGEAAVRSANATELAKRITYAEFRNSPYMPDDATVLEYFKKQLHLQMAVHRGTAGINGSGEPS